MAMNLAGLTSSLTALFASPPPTREACAQSWADAVSAYAAAVVPASATVAAASATLSTALAAAFAQPSAVAAMETAFTAWATTVAAGMVAGGWTGAPPAGAVGFSTLAGLQQATHAGAASAFATKINTWALTGTAVLIAPPFTPVAWT